MGSTETTARRTAARAPAPGLGLGFARWAGTLGTVHPLLVGDRRVGASPHRALTPIRIGQGFRINGACDSSDVAVASRSRRRTQWGP
jgi:hypothetical protein